MSTAVRLAAAMDRGIAVRAVAADSTTAGKTTAVHLAAAIDQDVAVRAAAVVRNRQNILPTLYLCQTAISAGVVLTLRDHCVRKKTFRLS